MRFSTIILAIAAALAPAALANPVDHHAIAERMNTQLSKRSARMTWYDITTAQVACSGWYKPTDFVVAMNKPQFQSSNWCGKQVVITYNGKKATATVVDECEGCAAGDLDLTISLFIYLFGDLGLGVTHTDWYSV